MTLPERILAGLTVAIWLGVLATVCYGRLLP